MPRSRSRSKERDRRRSRSRSPGDPSRSRRSRSRDRDRKHDRSRSRDRDSSRHSRDSTKDRSESKFSSASTAPPMDEAEKRRQRLELWKKQMAEGKVSAAAAAPAPAETEEQRKRREQEDELARKLAMRERIAQNEEDRRRQREEEERQRREVDGDVDPLDAFMERNVYDKAAADIAKSAHKEQTEDVRNLQKVAETLEAVKKGGKDADEEKYKPVVEKNMNAHCYICKNWGHSKRDCPQAWCWTCGKVGHKQPECEIYIKEQERLKGEAKQKKREQQYEQKKSKKRIEKDAELRAASGVYGFKALYRVLELPTHKLALESDITKQYRALARKYHPDRNPDNKEEAEAKFLELQSAYELLLEGIKNGGRDMGGACAVSGQLGSS